MPEKRPAVYILASKRNGTIYIGATADLARRVEEHRSGLVEGFTKEYEVLLLVYYEWHDTMEVALRRDRHLKKWKREWKLRLIEERNPQWKDLSHTLLI